MRRHMLNPLEDLNKMRGVFKAAVPANRLDGVSVAQHQAGVGNPHTIEITHICRTGLCLEAAAKVIFAVSGHFGHLFNGNFPVVVLVGPADQLLQAGGFEAGIGRNAALTAVHVARKLQKQLHNQGKTRHQVSVLRDQPLDNGFDLRIGRAQVLRLAQRQVLEGQIVLHIEIAVHLLKADFEHIHHSAPGADVVGVERIGRNDIQLLALQGKTLIVNHNFTTQIFAKQQLDRVGIVQRHDVLHLKLLDADGIGHLR